MPPNAYVKFRKTDRQYPLATTQEHYLTTDLHIARDGTIYVAERPDNEALENWISVRDTSGAILVRWQTPRSHQIWVDTHGDIYLVTGLRALPPHGAATKYVRVR